MPRTPSPADPRVRGSQRGSQQGYLWPSTASLASSSDSMGDLDARCSQAESSWPELAAAGSAPGEGSEQAQHVEACSDSDGEEEAVQEAGQDYINTLPSHLLLVILSQLDWTTKKCSAHLVCRRWAALCCEPSEMWHRIKLDFSWEGRAGPIRSEVLSRWLNQRAPAVRTLCLLRSEPVLTCRASEGFIGAEKFFHNFYPVPVEGIRALMAGLSSLQELDIESCNDLFIGNTYSALSTLTSLTRLELARLRKSILSHPTGYLGSLTRLVSLRMACEDDWHPGWTVLPAFPPEIEHLKQLTHLSITSKGIKEVPPFIGGLTALQDLRLCGCGLGALPQEISGLKSLTQLKLNSNPLGRGPSGDPEYEKSLLCLPQQLSLLTSLERLELMQCKLKSVPEAVLGLGQLRELMLGFNRIDRLPHQSEELRGLSSLRHISLFSNRLGCIPKAFSCLTALEELFLDDNLPLEFPDPLEWPLVLPRLLCLSAVKDMEQIEQVPTHSWRHDSLNHLLQLEGALAELHPGRRILRLCYGYSAGSPLLRDRAW